MKYLNKLASVFFIAALGVMTLTSCEGSELFNVNAPDWLSEMGGSEEEEGGEGEDLSGQMEDVYTIGATDFSTGWWAQFTKYYVIPEATKWIAEFNLHINPEAPNTYKNYAMIISNDEDRGAANYKEYGAIRFDNQPSGNSEWGDYIDRSLVESNLTFETDTDAGVDKLGGKVTLTLDRTEGGLVVKMTNGTITKTYTQTTELANLNADASNTNIRVFLVPEGSYIDWISTNIEPIGGCTEAGDKQPLKMTLNGAPKKVLLGTTMEEAFANVTATVEFEQGVTANVTAADLTFQAVPDMNSLGTKTLVAAYSKTYKGEGATAPVIASVQFDVVDKMYTCIGATDNSTAFWGAHSEYMKVDAGSTYVVSFTNYTSGAGNYANFLAVLTNADGSEEYGVLRADNWCWGTKFTAEEQDAHVTKVMEDGRDWATWLAAMDGAKVTVYVTNKGDGTADVKAVMIGNDGKTYTQEYKGLNTVTDPSNFYVHFTIDHSHIEFDDAIGADDNSTAFWGEHSSMIQVPKGETYVTRFKNYTSGAGNYANFLAVLTNADGSEEYGVLRADNWCWGTKFTAEEQDAHVTKVMEDGRDWATWLAAMDEAVVTVSVTNVGDGTANVKAVMVGNDGKTYTQEYKGLNTVSNPDEFYFHFTVDHCHLVFE